MQPDIITGATATVTIVVRDSSDATLAKTNPTIDALNDFLIDTGSGWETLDNSPTVSPAGSEFITITFSAAETTAAGSRGYILLRVADASDSDGWIGAPYRFEVRSAPLSTLTAAQVNAEVDTALADYDAPTKAELDSAIATVATPAQVASALATYDAPTFAEMVAAFAEIKGATWATTDTLEAIRDRGDAAWVTATGFATPTNVSDAQAAIIADTGATEAAALAAIAALNNLSAAQVWAYAARTLTGTAAAQTNPVVGSTLNITRAATFAAALTGLSVPDGWTSARFTIKRSSRKTEADTVSALLQILVTNGGDAGDGLVILNQSTSGLTAGDASLAISGTTATITIDDHVTQQLAKDTYTYDIKFYYGSSASVVATEATCNVVATPTETV